MKQVHEMTNDERVSEANRLLADRERWRLLPEGRGTLAETRREDAMLAIDRRLVELGADDSEDAARRLKRGW